MGWGMSTMPLSLSFRGRIREEPQLHMHKGKRSRTRDMGAPTINPKQLGGTPPQTHSCSPYMIQGKPYKHSRPSVAM